MSQPRGALVQSRTVMVTLVPRATDRRELGWLALLVIALCAYVAYLAIDGSVARARLTERLDAAQTEALISRDELAFGASQTSAALATADRALDQCRAAHGALQQRVDRAVAQLVRGDDA